MSENSEPIVIEEKNNAAPLSNARILWLMAAAVAVGALLSFVLADASFGLGFIFGGVLAFLNYYWLKVSLRNVFGKIAATGTKPPFLAASYILRYLAFGAILAIVFLTKTVPVVAVLLGLASFAAAVLAEALILLFSSFFKK